MTIEKAEALMGHYPREECPVVLPWMSRLEGKQVIAGFTMLVKELIGDNQGCAHLSSLVIAMGPAAVQGFWAAYGVDKNKLSLRQEAIKGVVNTCYLWRADGPLIRQLKEELKSKT
jgi:hypothetical protein